MRSLMRCFALAFLCAAGAFAQATDLYTVSYTVTLAGATTALAVQLPATGSGQAEIIESAVQCTAECGIRFEVNGAAATALNATAATMVALNPDSMTAAALAAPKIQGWYGTGVPTGTVVSPAWTLPAGALVPFGGARMMMTKPATNSNYIVRLTANYTGTVTMFFSVRVRR